MIIKRRYPYHYKEDYYSIDVFEGHLEGLILAEIEGHSESDIAILPIPPYAVKEVTDESYFTDGELAEL